MWSLFWELAANVGFAWLAIRTRLTGWIAIVGFFGVILIGSALTHNGLTRGPHDWSGGFVRVGFSFYCGVCLWQLRDRIRLPKIPASILLSILVISLAVPMIPHLNMFYDIIISMFLFPAIILIASKTALSGRWIGASELLGGISYPLYALHYPFVELMKPLYKTLGGGWFVGAGMLLSGTVLLPLLSYGVLHWFDEPVRIWLRSKLMVRQLARAQTAP